MTRIPRHCSAHRVARCALPRLSRNRGRIPDMHPRASCTTYTHPKRRSSTSICGQSLRRTLRTVQCPSADRCCKPFRGCAKCYTTSLTSSLALRTVRRDQLPAKREWPLLRCRILLVHRLVDILSQDLHSCTHPYG